MDTAEVPTITKSQLAAAFRTLGIAAGQTLMLHASAKAMGWMLGGPRIVLQTLLDHITPGGTLIMLASWEGNPYEMQRWPAAQREACLAECPPFDPDTSPADHREMSILAEYLRTWRGAHRSKHPMASFVAVGQRARWLTETHALQYGMGPDSPLARLCASDGYVLLLGVPFSNITLLHHAEHLAQVPNKRIDRYRMPIIQDGRRVWIDIEEYDTTDGIADFGSDDYFLDIGLAYVASGKGRTGQVGNARSYLFAAEDLKQFAIQWMQANYKGLLPPAT